MRGKIVAKGKLTGLQGYHPGIWHTLLPQHGGCRWGFFRLAWAGWKFLGATCHLCRGDFLECQIKCVRDGRNRSGESWLQKLALELWRDAASKLHQQLYVQMRKHIDQLIYFLFRQHTSAVSTHTWTQTENEGHAAKPVSALCCFCCIATILFFLVWMQYIFGLFTRIELNRWLKSRRSRFEGGVAVTSYIH